MRDAAPVVRAAGPADVTSLSALINEAYTVEAFFKRGDRTHPAEIVELMQKGQFLVIDAGDRPQGCVYVETNGERGYFGMLSIAPSRQRQGLGAALIEAAEECCRAAGCTTMELQVVSLRAELPPYYRKFGYAEAGVRECPPAEDWTQPGHFIVMSKRL